VDAQPFTVTPDDVVANGEGGMLGLEVDPAFATNGYVYVCMASGLDGASDVRLVRFTLRTPNGNEVLRRTDIVTGMPYSSGRHSGCRPRFGPDGYLWVGTGDAAIGSTPQDDSSLGGKVLRVDRDGDAAPDNPGGRIWISKGHRNVQGIAFRSRDGLGVSAEHGPSIDDEVNLLLPGNFGWDPVPGYNESVPMTDLGKFPDALEAIWSSGSPTLALSGATFIEGNRWGDWDGVLTVATLKATHLHIYFLTSAGEVTRELRVIEDRAGRPLVHHRRRRWLWRRSAPRDPGAVAPTLRLEQATDAPVLALEHLDPLFELVELIPVEPLDVASEEVFVERHLRQRARAIFPGEHPVRPARAVEVTAPRHVVHVSSDSDEKRSGRIRTVVACELRERVVPLLRYGQRRTRLLLLPEQASDEAT
jgi:hypothetical protein